MFNFPVVFVDIETTGGSYKTSRIIEIAIIRYENGEITDTYSTFINPGSRLPSQITQLTGISSEDVADAPYFEDLACEIHEKLKDAVFIAHHVRFDFSFIKRQLEACGYPFNPKLLCSVRMSRALYPEHKGHSLQKIIDRHNIPVKARHRAYDDALAVQKFMELAYQVHGHELFHKAISLQLKSRSLPPNLDAEYLKGVEDTPGVYIFENEDGTPIYIGKSVTLRKRIMSHFTQSTKLNKEMKLSMNTHSLRTIQTGSELEALLLESQMVKELLPVYNQQLRRVRSQVVVFRKVNGGGYATLSTSLEDLSETENFQNIYGVFKTKSRARASLELIQKTYDLCPKLMGLENGSGPCFKYQIKKCAGACAGKMSPKDYNARLETAMQRLKMEAWPFKQPIVLQLSDHKGLVVDNWSVIGYYFEEIDTPPYIERTVRSFDMDTYKILRSYLSKSPRYKPLPSLELLA